MFSTEKMDFLDFDIYSRNVSFYYKNKEKLGSTFGFILTIIYGIASVILFLLYFIKVLKREEMTSSDSLIYPTSNPSIQLNNDLFYIAFGLEHPKNLSRYIDETIYLPKVEYIEKIKNNSELITISKKVLNIERCNSIKFGKDYQNLVEKDELNNSYCINDFNLTLIGSLKYNRISYIEINLYPCVNNSENNNHCKPQNIIDTYLTSTYFSIITKDIGLNPFNYFFPTIPFIQNLYTSIDKSIKKEFIIYFGITEINTDIGLFSNIYKKEIYLRYIENAQSFNFINKEEYHSGKEILTAKIKLEDNIYSQKRTYTKMSSVFSIIGGYMQVIYTVFALIVLLSKKISIEKKLLNSLFNFNIKQKKIILSIEYEKKLDYNSSLDKTKQNKYIPYEAKKSILMNNKNKRRHSQLVLNINKNNQNITTLKKFGSNKNIIPSGIREMKSQANISEDGFIEIIKTVSKEKIKNTNNNNQSINRSKANMLNQEDNSYFNDLKLYKNYEAYKKIKSSNNLNIFSDLRMIEKENYTIINFNIFDYYCFKKITKKRTEIELFKFGINFYKRQMDIINFFNIMILTQIMLIQNFDKKNNNILSQKIELSIK